MFRTSPYKMPSPVPNQRFSKKRRLLALMLFLLMLLVLFLFKNSVWAPGGKSKNSTKTSDSSQQAFDKSKYSTSKPGSLWWVVNKNRPLPAGYAPPDLVVPNVPVRISGDEAQVSKKIVADLEAMVAAAKKDGIQLMMASGYRSYALQVSVYDQNVRNLGQREADKVSAKPGTSEHQTGLSLDVEPVSRQCEIQECFGTLPEGKWVATHAHEYGFIVRYPKGKQSITGYNYEPWHLRYVGRDLAAELKRTNILTLEEFFGL